MRKPASVTRGRAQLARMRAAPALTLPVRRIAQYAPSQFVPALTALVTVPVFTRLLTPAEFGYAAAAMVTIALLVVVSSSWLSPSILRFFPHREEERAAYFRLLDRIVLVLVAAILLTGSGGAVLVATVDGIWPPFVAAVAVSVPAGVLFDVLAAVARAAHEIRAYSLAELARAVVGAGAGIALVTLGSGGSGLIWGTLAGTAIAVVPIGRVARRMSRAVSAERRTEAPALFGDLLRYGLPLLASTSALWVLSLSDRYLLGLLADARELGLYSVGATFAEKPLALIGVLCATAAGPLLIEAWEKSGRERAQVIYDAVIRTYLALAVPTLIAFALVASPVAERLFGEDFAGATRVLIPIAVGSLFYGLYVISHAGLYLTKRTIVAARNVALAAAANVGLNLLLIPQAGAAGAAWATAIAYGVLVVLTLAATRRSLPTRIDRRDLGVGLAASTAMVASGALVLTLGPGGLGAAMLAGVAGLAAYGLALVVTRGARPRPEDVIAT